MKAIYIFLVATALVSCGDIGNDQGREAVDTPDTVYNTSHSDAQDTNRLDKEGLHPLDSAK